MSSTAVVAGEQLWVKQPISTLPTWVLSDNYLERSVSNLPLACRRLVCTQFQSRIRRYIPTCRLCTVRNLLGCRSGDHQTVIRAIFKPRDAQGDARRITTALRQLAQPGIRNHAAAQQQRGSSGVFTRHDRLFRQHITDGFLKRGT